VRPDDIRRLANAHLKLGNIYLAAVGPQELDLGRHLSKNSFQSKN
jgi:hypothetical protein